MRLGASKRKREYFFKMINRKGSSSHAATFTKDVNGLKDFYVLTALSEQQQRLDAQSTHFPLLSKGAANF